MRILNRDQGLAADITRPTSRPAEPGQAASIREKVRPMGGFSISQITGPTRDILVDLLSPLRTLGTVFPAMLDELKGIRAAVEMRAGGQGLPAMPLIAAGGAGASGIEIMGDIHVHVDQLADANVEEINSQLFQQLRLDRRQIGNQDREVRN